MLSFIPSLATALAQRPSAPRRSPLHCSSLPSTALAPFQRAAILRTNTLFGDAEDENMPYHRWRFAQSAIRDFQLATAPPTGPSAAPASPKKDRNLVYGELDLELFFELINLAGGGGGGGGGDRDDDDGAATVFMDVGSGQGRLALAAACAYAGTWSVCRGVEIVPGLHAEALENLAAFRAGGGPLCDVDFSCEDLRGVDFSGCDLCFCYATTWGDPFDGVLHELSRQLGGSLRAGARVITVDKELDCADGFELIGKAEGQNSETGGSSGFVWEKTGGRIGEVPVVESRGGG